MKLSRKDLAFGVGAVAILLIVLLGTNKELGPDVPNDAEHQAFFIQLEQGQSRQEVEQGCNRCHPVAELPQTHPHKQECMVCHKRG
jgi:uncharacterized paraquat-inducible protein A